MQLWSGNVRLFVEEATETTGAEVNCVPANYFETIINRNEGYFKLSILQHISE